MPDPCRRIPELGSAAARTRRRFTTAPLNPRARSPPATGGHKSISCRTSPVSLDSALSWAPPCNPGQPACTTAAGSAGADPRRSHQPARRPPPFGPRRGAKNPPLLTINCSFLRPNPLLCRNRLLPGQPHNRSLVLGEPAAAAAVAVPGLRGPDQPAGLPGHQRAHLVRRCRPNELHLGEQDGCAVHLGFGSTSIHRTAALPVRSWPLPPASGPPGWPAPVAAHPGASPWLLPCQQVDRNWKGETTRELQFKLGEAGMELHP